MGPTYKVNSNGGVSSQPQQSYTSNNSHTSSKNDEAKSIAAKPYAFKIVSVMSTMVELEWKTNTTGMMEGSTPVAVELNWYVQYDMI
jgi:hypothetical protein